MKIAFVEYCVTIRSGGDEMFMACLVQLLRKFGNEVDVLQYHHDKNKSYSCFKDIDIKTISTVDELNKYDIVITNNLYMCRDMVTQEYLVMLGSTRAKTLYINHDRPTIRQFFRGPNNVTLMNYCDASIGYYDNLMKHIVPSNKIHKITFGHFYKPNEDNKPEEFYTHGNNVLYMARLNRVKGFYRYMELANKIHSIDTTWDFTMYGFSGNIGQVPMKKMPEMIVELGKEPTANSENSFVHFRPAISERQNVVNALKQSAFSWNAWSFAARGKELYHVIDNGLEAAPLEALRYGCVPILHDIHKDLDIPYDSNDTSKVIKFGDINCAVFTNDAQDMQELYEDLNEEASSFKKHTNAKNFVRLLNNDALFYNTWMRTLQQIVDSPYCRSKTPCSRVDEYIDTKELMTKGRIR